MAKKKTDYEKYLEEIHSKKSLPEEVLNAVVKDIVGSSPAGKEKILKGEANEVYDLRTKAGDEVFVRIERGDGPGFVQEAWAIEQCRKIKIPVPEVLGVKQLNLNDEKVAICIQRKIEGDTLERGNIKIDELDKNYLRKIINQAGEILSKIHTIPTQGFDRINENGVGMFKTSEEMMLEAESQKDEYSKLAKKINLDHRILEKAMKLLFDYRELYASIKPCLNHGDFGPKHIMVKGDKITGILDWGEAQGNSPIFDIARWDYWFGDWVPTEWLKEGYADKTLFDKDYDLLDHLIKLRAGLILIYWYDQFNYPKGVERAKARLIKDLEFFG